MQNTQSKHDTIKNEILSIVQKKNQFDKLYQSNEDYHTQEDTSETN